MTDEFSAGEGRKMDFGVELMSVEVFETLSLLTPYDIDRPKIRVGPERDGGYVMADLPSKSDLFSFGISNDVRFEKCMAEAGHRCFMYDHTITELPDHHRNFRFHRKGICGANTAASDLASLEAHIAAAAPSDSLLLKIDVEGAEWDAFATMPEEVLSRFDQIVGEFHWFLELGNPQFLTCVREALLRLRKHFTLFHVHANNCRKLGQVGGFTVADVLELSFVKTHLVNPGPSKTIYPALGDSGNNPFVHDHALLFYPFLPSTPATLNVRETIDRIAGQRILSV